MLSKLNGNEAVVSACGQGNGLFVLKVIKCPALAERLSDESSEAEYDVSEDEVVGSDSWYRERIANARTPRRRMELARGCRLLHEALEEARGNGALTQMSESELLSPQYSVGEHGKPDFVTEGIHFNISHSEEYMACILYGQSVGIDIQTDYRWITMDTETGTRQKKERTLTGIQYFAPQEQAELENIESDVLKRSLFFTLWTRKEALAKFYGKPLATVLGVDLRDEVLPMLCAEKGLCFDDSVPAPGVYMSICIQG